jgi:hypothetical protein
LVKLSGNPDIEKTPAIKLALKRAEYYVQEYSYEPPVDAESNYTIRIRFEKTDMNRLLKKSSVAYWGEKRPLILVWLVTTNINEDYQIIGSEESSNLFSAFKKEGKKYGLPLIFPMMDMTDLDQVTPDDVAGMKIAVLNSAGKRYAPDALLIGKVIDNKSELSSRWVLVVKGNSTEFTVSNLSPDLLFSDLLNQVRQTLAKQMATVTPEALPQIALKLQVTNVSEPEDLTQLMAFLKQLTPVLRVQLSQVLDDVVDMDIQLQGTLASFQQNTALTQRMMLTSQDATSNKLIYEWKH